MLLVAIPAAAAPTLPQDLKPPYHPMSVKSVVTPYSRGCARLNSTAPQFNNATGIGNFSASAKARSCSKPGGGPSTSSNATLTEETSVMLPINSPSSGSVNETVRVNLTLRANASSTQSLRWNCPSAHRNSTRRGIVSSTCRATSSIALSLGATILDLNGPALPVMPTNQIVGYSESTLDYADDNCYVYGCWWSNYSFSYSSGLLNGNLSWFFNTTLSASSHYGVLITVGGSLVVGLKGFASSSISARLDLGSNGDEWELTAVTVS